MGGLQIHSVRLGVIVVDLFYFALFWRLFTIKMIKRVKVFPSSFWKIAIFFTSWNLNPRHKHAKLPLSDLTPWALTLTDPGLIRRIQILFSWSPGSFDIEGEAARTSETDAPFAFWRNFWVTCIKSANSASKLFSPSSVLKSMIFQ